MGNYTNRLLIVAQLINPNSASANRLMCVLKGLKENGVEPIVFAFDSNEEMINVFVKEGVVCVNSSFIKNKLLNFIINLIRCVFVIRRYNNIFFYIGNFYVVRMLYFFSKRKSIIVCESTEHPKLNKGEKNLVGLLRLYQKIDKLLVISSSLKDYFIDKGIKHDKIYLYPILINPKRFEMKLDPIFDFPYMAYTGEMGYNKDGLCNLIDSFNIFSKQNTEYKLVLIGDSTDKKEYNRIKQYVKDLALDDRIVFTGRVAASEVPRYLQHAKVLLLARPNNFQAKYGLPTKMGEYLATGNPVIITDTSDISVYLKDNVSAYIVEPDNIEAFADKMLYVVNHYEEAKIVGREGKKKIYDDFNYFVQTNKMLEWLFR